MTSPSHAEQARTLVSANRDGTLSTLSARLHGHPFGSCVLFSMVGDDPILLISNLAEHTKNLQADPRCSLLVSTPGAAPLSAGRVTLVCQAAPDASPEAQASFLAAHPDASVYVGFRDFSFWRLSVQTARYVGGFGRMSWLSAADWAGAEPDPLQPYAQGIIAHMNADHVDAMLLYCHVLLGEDTATHVQMVGVDRYGIDMETTTPAGTRTVRLPFPQPANDAMAVRRVLVALAQQARQG